MTIKHLFLLSFIFILIGCAGPDQGGPGGIQANTQTGSVVASFQQVVAEPAASVATQTAADCPAEHFLDVQTANPGYATPTLNITCKADTFVIESNGIPNFEYVQVTPNDLQAQDYRWEITLKPQQADEPGSIPLLGTIAVTVNGLPIFGPNEAPTHDWGDPYLDEMLDYCNGHTAPQGMYHFHARPDCLFTDLEGNVGLVIGYALDGYPILAPYIYEDAGGTTLTEVQSSWQRTTDVTAAWEAHEYIAGSGDLDQCNGLEFSDGTYAYFATDTFPYFLGCYRGLVDATDQPDSQPPQDGGVLSIFGDGSATEAAPQDSSPATNGPSIFDGGQQGAQPRGGPDFAAAAAQIGVSEQALRDALGAPPPDFAAAAAQLGLNEQVLRDAVGPPPGQP